MPMPPIPPPTEARTVHKLKPGAYPERDDDELPPPPTSAAELFECGRGDLATSAAFEELPPAYVLERLQPCTVCPDCFPEHRTPA